MDKATITVPVDPQGRITIPAGVRRELGIDGESAMVEVEVRRCE